MKSRVKSVTYASTYTKAYKRKGNLDEWISKEVLKARDVRSRLWKSLHVMKMFRTQSIGALMSISTLDDVNKTYRMASLEARLRLRHLQHTIIAYLWRPGGKLYESASNTFLTFQSQTMGSATLAYT